MNNVTLIRIIKKMSKTNFLKNYSMRSFFLIKQCLKGKNFSQKLNKIYSGISLTISCKIRRYLLIQFLHNIGAK